MHEHVKNSSTTGYLCVITAAVLWASSGAVGKVLFQGGMTPFELVQVRVTMAAALLGIAFLVSSPRLLVVERSDWSLLLLVGVVMGLVQFTYFYAISKMQVMAAVLLQYMAPLFVTFFSVLFWGERLTAMKLVSLLLAVSGCYLVVGGYSLQILSLNRMGVLGGLASALCYAAYALLGERAMHRYSPWTVVFYALLIAAVIWNILYSPFHYLFAAYSIIQWQYILYVVFLGTIAPFGLYFMGINYIRSTRAMITATLEPITAGLIAFLVIGETLESLQLLGSGLVVAAVILVQIRREHDALAPAVIRNGVPQTGN